jgi:hypothetical protein
MITCNELSAFYQANKIELSQSVSILKREWCPFAQGIGRCDYMCSANSFCMENIQEILEVREEARNRYAVITWRAKEVRSKIADTTERPRLEKNHFGETKSDFMKAIRMAGGSKVVQPANSGAARALQALHDIDGPEAACES